MAVLQLDSDGLARLVAQVAASLRQDAALRDIQGRNAQQAKYFDQPGVFPRGGVIPPAVTGNVVYNIVEAQSGSEVFYSLVLTFDQASGSGRFRIDGSNPTVTTGIQIPAAGTVLTILGNDNIQRFRMIAEAGQTLTFGRYLFI